ncbi:MAG: FAD-binding protein [Oscillospiraceae bacterium]|jgi:uncharacterized protein with FMN-binding domain/succinate dehydrogenase/fumarate reductase flavoprotein subunit|nr:FAD-binding protein [Oscillospiraceae bacterium]
MKKRLAALALAFAMVLGTVALAAGAEKTITVSPMTLTVNGQTVTPSKSNGAAAEVFAYDGATYVPLRYLSELLGLTVEWDPQDPDVAKITGNVTLPSGGNGTYTAEAQGFGGKVTVTLTVADGKLTKVAVTGDKETEGVGSRAVAQLPDAILAAGSAEVDAVTGATITSNAIKQAAREALAAAGLFSLESAVKMKAGTYEGEAYGFSLCRKVKATVKVSEDKIESITVDPTATGDTQDFMETVIELMIPRILANQSLAVDSITGATSSSAGVKAAVKQALGQALAAGGNAEGSISAFYKPVAKPAEQQEELHTQVLVIGMGGSGTATAVSAAENGLEVIAIDKMGRYGGTTSCTGEMFSVNPENHKKINNGGKDYVDKAALRADWLAYTEGDEKTEMVDLILDHSGEALDWLDQKGFDFSPVALGGLTENDPFHVKIEFFPYTIDIATARIMEYFDTMYEYVTAKGGKYLLETEGTELITDKTGAVIGAKAYNSATNTHYTIYADNVVLATGGFAGNEEMTTKYLSDEHFDLKGKWSVYGLRTNDGKMLQSALDLGAAPYNIGIAPMVHNAGTPRFLTGFETHETQGMIGLRNNAQPVVWSEADAPLYMCISQKCLGVSRKGVRFTNEEMLSMLNSWIAGPQFYSIWSTAQIDQLRDKGFDHTPIGPASIYLGYQGAIPENTPISNIYEVLDAAVESGIAYRADTAEELAQKLGMDAKTLKATIDSYNKACAAGTDTEFGKNPAFLSAVGEGPYYCIVGTPYCYTTCGGLDVNTSFQVLDQAGKPMEGLYAVGTDCMGVLFSEKKAYSTYGGVANGWGLTSGMLCGQAIAEKYK